MTTAWDYAKKLADQHASAANLFVRLPNDGDKVVGVFCGEPFAREVFWTGETYADSPAEAGAKPTLRVSLNFFVPAEGAMKIIEGGASWFRDLVDVRTKYGLDKWSFEVKRRGKKGDPKTRYTILPDAPVDEGLRARIGQTTLHDLTAMGAGAEGEAGAPTQPMAAIDEPTARALADRLRLLPREALQAFLAEFQIERLRELSSSDLPGALRFIEGRERPLDNDPLAP